MKYLELFKDGFDDTISSRCAYDNWPFVGHDVLTGEVVYTELPVNEVPYSEIWYTTTDGNTIYILDKYLDSFGAEFISNTYENGKGVLKFQGIVTQIPDDTVTRVVQGVFSDAKNLKTITLP